MGLLLLGLLSGLVLLAAAAAVAGGMSLAPMACGFVWAENAAFDPATCTLWVGAIRGEGGAYTVRSAGEGGGYAVGKAAMNGTVSGFLGMQYDAGRGVVYANGLGGSVSGSGEGALVAFANDGTSRVLTRCATSGNGLAQHGDTLYYANEGKFIPFLGSLHAVTLPDYTVHEVVKGAGALDGVGVWEHPLGPVVGVSSVVAHKLILYNATSPLDLKKLTEIKVSGATSIDDFLFVPSATNPAEATIVGADYLGGKVFTSSPFTVSSTSASVVASVDVKHPTSVRPAHSPSCPGFDGETKLIVTQGNSLIGHKNTSCVYQLTL